MKRIAVMTSGGDAPGMNAAIRAVVRAGIAEGVEVYGIRQAYQGLLAGDMERLTSREVSGILQRGGTILQTARNEEFKTAQGQRKALRRLNEQNIEGIVVIGGDGSLRGANVLSQLGIPTVGIPASIDNDIYGTDTSIGVDTALNTIQDALDRLRDTATSHNRCFIIEVMGRNCGYLALTGGILGGAEVIITPEKPMAMEEVARELEEAYVKGKAHAIAIIAEGAPYKVTDLSEFLEKQQVGFEIRLTILGHTQRGGSPSAFDRLLATRMGVEAVHRLLAGESGVMVARQGRKHTTVPLEEVTSRMREISDEYFELAELLQ
ncbi:MAG: 6-phosphofructokinase [Anaerolineae bacterium]|nr:6-phosphofructokinase [Anaerolineae bacterium]MCA9892686.1 6-phosphofructokinase [Anaerolineae bacterium]MCB9459175.1 6-phosphofructokinase [Anaerolineaceae bacterium]